MQLVNIYSKKAKIIIRSFSIATFCILSVSTLFKFYHIDDIYNYKSFLGYVYLGQNIITLFLSLVLFFFPQKIGIISIIAFSYSITCSLSTRNIPMSILMYILSILVAMKRGFFRNQKLPKYILLLLLYISLWFLPCFYGMNNLLISILQHLGYSFIIFVIIYFYFSIFNKTSFLSTEKILNVADYHTFTKETAVLLNHIKNKLQYKEISKIEKMSSGTVRNKMSYIFKTLECGDKKGFLDKYGDYQIIFLKKTD